MIQVMQSNLPNDSVARVSKSIRLNNVAIRRARRLVTLLQLRGQRASVPYPIIYLHAVVVVLSRGQMQFRRRIVKIEAPQSAAACAYLYVGLVQLPVFICYQIAVIMPACMQPFG
jgi:hypothetical protein